MYRIYLVEVLFSFDVPTYFTTAAALGIVAPFAEERKNSYIMYLIVAVLMCLGIIKYNVELRMRDEIRRKRRKRRADCKHRQSSPTQWKQSKHPLQEAPDPLECKMDATEKCDNYLRNSTIGKATQKKRKGDEDAKWGFNRIYSTIVKHSSLNGMNSTYPLRPQHSPSTTILTPPSQAKGLLGYEKRFLRLFEKWIVKNDGLKDILSYLDAKYTKNAMKKYHYELLLLAFTDWVMSNYKSFEERDIERLKLEFSKFLDKEETRGHLKYDDQQDLEELFHYVVVGRYSDGILDISARASKENRDIKLFKKCLRYLGRVRGYMFDNPPLVERRNDSHFSYDDILRPTGSMAPLENLSGYISKSFSIFTEKNNAHRKGNALYRGGTGDGPLDMVQLLDEAKVLSNYGDASSISSEESAAINTAKHTEKKVTNLWKDMANILENDVFTEYSFPVSEMENTKKKLVSSPRNLDPILNVDGRKELEMVEEIQFDGEKMNDIPGVDEDKCVEEDVIQRTVSGRRSITKQVKMASIEEESKPSSMSDDSSSCTEMEVKWDYSPRKGTRIPTLRKET